MTITLNGERHDIPQPLSVTELLQQLDIDARRVAVEGGRLAYLAGRIPRKAYASASSPLQGVIGS